MTELLSIFGQGSNAARVGGTCWHQVSTLCCLMLQVIEVVCCKPTTLQKDLYCHFLKSKAARKLVSGQKSAGVLSAITNLKKLCNHPKLIYDSLHSVDKDKSGPAEGFEVHTHICVNSQSACPPCLHKQLHDSRQGVHLLAPARLPVLDSPSCVPDQ